MTYTGMGRIWPDCFSQDSWIQELRARLSQFLQSIPATAQPVSAAASDPAHPGKGGHLLDLFLGRNTAASIQAELKEIRICYGALASVSVELIEILEESVAGKTVNYVQLGLGCPAYCMLHPLTVGSGAHTRCVHSVVAGDFPSCAPCINRDLALRSQTTIGNCRVCVGEELLLSSWLASLIECIDYSQSFCDVTATEVAISFCLDLLASISFFSLFPVFR